MAILQWNLKKNLAINKIILQNENNQYPGISYVFE